MDGSVWMPWVTLTVALAAALGVDQWLHSGSSGRPTVRRAAVETIVWTALGVAFTGVVIAFRGATGGADYLTGYALEKTLSLDNVAVFAVVVAAFGVAAHAERRLIDHAILAALLLRLAFIAGGLAVLDRVHAVLFGFGAILIISGLRMFRSGHEPSGGSPPRVIGLIRRVLVTGEPDGARYLSHPAGSRTRRVPTPMLIALIALAVTDVVFAVDSVPAIFAVTSDAWIVCAANAFALLGLRPMYFLLAAALNRLAYLRPGLAVILVGIGGAMLAEQFVEVPVLVTLGFVVGVLTISVVASLRSSRPPAPPQDKEAVDRGYLVSSHRTVGQ